MNRKRIVTAALLSAGMGTFFAAGVYAQDVLQKVEAYLRPDFRIVVDGRTTGMTPLIYEGSSYVPFKALGELLGADVSWDESTKTIKVNRPAAGSGSQSGGAQGGTPGGSGTASPGTGSVPSTDDVEVEEEITLDTLMRYNFIYNNVDHPTLANIYKGTIYLRWKDIKDIPIDIGKPKLSTEKLTGEQYIHIDLLKPYWGDQVSSGLWPYAIVEEGTVEEDKLKALNDYFGQLETGFTIKPLEGENEYTVLAQSADKWYAQYNIRFWTSYDGKWHASSTGWRTYPKETDTP